MDNHSYIFEMSIGWERSISINKLSTEVKALQTFVSAWFGTEKPNSFQLGLHHFNLPQKASSYKGDKEVLHQ